MNVRSVNSLLENNSFIYAVLEIVVSRSAATVWFLHRFVPRVIAHLILVEYVVI
jgi:hypothetical protein